MIEPLQRPATLKDSALAELRSAITTGRLAPGARLKERVLCEQLGVSRTVVRECIRHLESERLVTSVPNAGPSVAVLENDEIAEIYSIRALLEAEAAASCARHADADTVASLHAACDAIAKALGRGRIDNALAETTRFYALIFECGGKPVSWDLVSRLNGRISRLRALTLASAGRIESGPGNLRAIVNAIESGDARGAARACKHHIKRASKIALQENAR